MRAQTLAEARWIFAVLGALMIMSWFVMPWLSFLFLLLILFTLAFFRDPERVVPADPNLVVAAADGNITDIIEMDENEVLKTKTRRVGIFLSIFDVHTNGAIARRIVSWSQAGDEVKKGDRFGMIRFGSRTEVYLPLNAEILVKPGDLVRGGSTIIARLSS
jgi:phosphatidylserine decarboxylase